MRRRFESHAYLEAEAVVVLVAAEPRYVDIDILIGQARIGVDDIRQFRVIADTEVESRRVDAEVEVGRGVRSKRVEVLVEGERTVDTYSVAVDIDIVEFDYAVTETQPVVVEALRVGCRRKREERNE